MARWTRKELTNGASLCLELASGLLENGAETSRVEETVRMAGEALGMEVEAMVHPTGITVGFGEGEVITRVARIKERSVNLSKVAELNRLSRAMHDQTKVDIPNLRARISEVREAPTPYGTALELAATATTCGCLTVVLGGGAGEALMAMLAGCATNLLMKRFANTFPSFLSLFGAGFLSSLVGLLGHHTLGLSMEPIVVGSLLYLMPGLAFVSAMRDLMAGELVAGNARLAEALVVTLGMASGVLACLGFAVRMGVGT
jgi:uncharacterized membrane protein YjjP (DUF1212 family)